MADTANFGWTKPVNGATGWDVTLNALFDDVDTDADAIKTTADAALPLAGGVMTGRVDVFSATAGLTALGSISGATDIDLSLSDVFSATIAGATTFSFTNTPSGTWLTGFIVFLTNGGTNVTWPASVDWPSGAEPSLQASGVDILGFMTIDSGTTWHGVLISGDSS